MDFNELVTLAVSNSASDLHLATGLPPIIRLDGDLHKLNLAALTQEDMAKFMRAILDEKQQKILQQQLEIDFALQINNDCRLRANIFKQMRGISAVFRIIPKRINGLEEPDFPAIFKKIACYPHGLVLVVGPTGSGKSTTVAAFIDHINTHYYKHIITVEDPIEFIYESKNCLINQREIQRHSPSFVAALRSILREDPDIILIGELRDYETIRLALTAAETGHLVFATLHTNSATKALNRIVDAFPGDEKVMIRSMLSESLQAVIAQTLVKKIGGGRIAAFEIMICNSAVRNLIRDHKFGQIYSAIQTGQNSGMQTLDQHLTKLITTKLITKESLNFAI